VLRTRVGMIALFLAGLTATTVAQTPPADPKKPADPAKPAQTPPAADPKQPAPAQPPAGGDNKQAFEFKFEKDKPFYQEMKTEVTQTIKVQGGSDLTQKHDQTFLFKWLPTAQTGDKWTVKQTIEGVKMTIDIAGNQVKYDSTAPNEPGQASNPGLTDFFGKLVGSDFTVTFGKGMTVEKVEGKDEFLKKLGGINQQMESLLKKMLTDEAMKQMSDPSFGLTPPAPKAVGETWEKKSSLSLGPIGSYDVTTKYTYKGKDPVRKELDRVEVVPTLTYKAPTDQDGLLFKIKGGTLTTGEPTAQDKSGYVLFNPATGKVEESQISVKMKGNLNVTIGGTDTTIDLNQEQTTTVKTADKSFLPEKK
jgi:hypothetical protein